MYERMLLFIVFINTGNLERDDLVTFLELNVYFMACHLKQCAKKWNNFEPQKRKKSAFNIFHLDLFSQFSSLMGLSNKCVNNFIDCVNIFQPVFVWLLICTAIFLEVINQIHVRNWKVYRKAKIVIVHRSHNTGPCRSKLNVSCVFPYILS